MDQFYFEAGYLEEDYFGYVASAEVTISAAFTPSFTVTVADDTGYYIPDYIQDGYITGIKEFDAALSSISDLTVTTGLLQSAVCDAAGLFTPTVVCVATKNSFAILDSVFSQTVSALRTRDNLSALSVSSELTIAFGNIQSADAGISAEFTESVTVSRTRQALASIDSAMTATVSISLTKVVDIAALVDFAIAIDGNLIADSSATLENIINQSLQAARTRSVESTHSVTASQTADISRTRNTESSLEVQSQITATISHIEGADIVLTPFAALTIDAVKTTDATLSTNTTATVSAVIGKKQISTIALISNFSVFASRYLGAGRPRDFFQPTFSSIRKFGDSSLDGLTTYFSNNVQLLYGADIVPNWYTDDFAIEAWFYIKANASGTHDILRFQKRGNLVDSFIKLQINSSEQLTYTYYTNDITQFTPQYISPTLALNTWHHVLVVEENPVLSLYLNGTRVDTLTWPQQANRYWTGDNTTVYYRSGGTNILVDELSFHVGTTLGYSPSSSSITVPTQPRTNDPDTTVFLYHFEDRFDDISVQVDASASISAQSSVQATITGPQRVSATLSAAFTQTAIANVDRGADIVAFSDGALTADVLRIQSTTADFASEFDQTTDALKAAEGQSSLASEFAQNIDYLRIRDTAIDTDSIATQVSVVAKVADFFVNADVVASVSVEAVKTTDVDSSQSVSADQTAAGARIRDVDSSQSAEANLAATSSRTRPFEITTASEFAQSTTVAKITDVAPTLFATFTVEATTQGTIDYIAIVSSFGTMTVINDTIRYADSAQSSEFAVFAETADSLNKTFDADLSSVFTETVEELRIRPGVIATDSIATQLAAVAKTGNALIAADIVSAQTTVAQKTTDVIVSAASESTVDATAIKTTDSVISVSAVATVQAEGTSNITAEGVLVTAFTQSAAANVSATASADMSVSADLSIDVIRQRPFASLVMSMGELTVTAVRTRDNSANVTAEATIVTAAGKTVDVSCEFGALFSPSVSIRKIFINIYVYRIPQEIRVYRVPEDRREYTIPEETRTYTIRR